jgi:hypothetical protein
MAIYPAPIYAVPIHTAMIDAAPVNTSSIIHAASIHATAIPDRGISHRIGHTASVRATVKAWATSTRSQRQVGGEFRYGSQ